MTDQSVNGKMKILESALKVYSSKPPEMVTVEDVAHEAGVSKGLIFYHYKNKDNLEKEVALFFFKKVFIETSEEVKSVKDLFDVTAKNFSELQHLMRFTAYISGKMLYSGDYGFFREFFNEVMDMVVPLFEKEKVIKPKVTATALMAMFDGLGLYSLFYDIGDINDYRKLALDLVECRKVRK